MNNTHVQREEGVKGTRGSAQVEEKVKGIKVEQVKDQSGAGGRERRRALTQHSGPDCRLSTSPNCQGQTLSVSDGPITEMLWRCCRELNKGAFTVEWPCQQIAPLFCLTPF